MHNEILLIFSINLRFTASQDRDTFLDAGTNTYIPSSEDHWNHKKSKNVVKNETHHNDIIVLDLGFQKEPDRHSEAYRGVVSQKNNLPSP